MKKMFPIVGVLLLCCLRPFSQAVFKDLNLNDLSAFQPNAGNWFIVGKVAVDPDPLPPALPAAEALPQGRRSKKNKKDAAALVTPAAPDPVSYEAGTGILLNKNTPEKKDNLVTNWQHGDIELELEVLLPKGSNSGIYLQGQYEVQLYDSWGRKNPRYSDIGGIYRNHLTSGPDMYLGKAPLVNAAKAPGLWQKLSIFFRAPRFNDQGEKIANARFEWIELNGIKIHDNVEVPRSTGGAMDSREKAMGPLMIQGDHGAVAFRNIRYKLVKEPPKPAVLPDPDVFRWPPVPPIAVSVGSSPKLLRAFLDFKGDRARRLTHTIAVGDPRGVHYIYDLNAGNLACVWRGEFIDATPMWHSRGDGSYLPKGITQYLFTGPSLAYLSDPASPFPDSVEQSAFRREGYRVDGTPVFLYTYQGAEVTDGVYADSTERSIVREISFKNLNTASAYVKLAEGKNIAPVHEGLYVVGDREYYIQLLSGQQPHLRQSSGDDHPAELLLKADGNPVKYSIIW